MYTRPTISSQSLRRRHSRSFRPVANAQRLTIHRSVHIHLLNLSDGFAYSGPHSSIAWESPQGVNEICVQRVAITSSRVMIQVCYRELAQQTGMETSRLFVWDWKTGDLVRLLRLEQPCFTDFTSQVLDLPSEDESVHIGWGTEIFFLDEFRMMVSTPGFPDVPEFTLFNTLTPGGHPASSRRFRVPQEYRGKPAFVFVDPHRCLGTHDRDRPLITDPTQAVLVMELVDDWQRILVIVRIQTLVGHLHSVDTDGCVSWDEWKRGAAVMKVERRSGRSWGPFVQGVHVVLVEERIPPGVGRKVCLSTFDFSRWGYGTVPPERGDEIDRVSHKRDFFLPNIEMMGICTLELLDDNSFVYLDTVSHIWELV